jgi:hypothetical protein
MTRYAFTGPSRLTAADEDVVPFVVAALDSPTEITTGAADGWDTEVALAALVHWPNALHRIVTPGAKFNLQGVNDAIELARRLHVERFEIITLPEPESGGPAAAYRARNRVMVDDHCDVLWAGLRSANFYRSGEWMTVNLARKAGKPVRMSILGPAS